MTRFENLLQWEGSYMATRTNRPYLPGELEVILSLAPTKQNIVWLATLLNRSEAAIAIVYKQAFEHGPFGASANIQVQKIVAAKKRVGIAIGRKTMARRRSSRRPSN
jgi:hypothetical protein